MFRGVTPTNLQARAGSVALCRGILTYLLKHLKDCPRQGLQQCIERFSMSFTSVESELVVKFTFNEISEAIFIAVETKFHSTTGNCRKKWKRV